MKNLTLTAALILTTTLAANAQLEIGVSAMPAISNFDGNRNFSSTFPFNYGLNVKYSANNFVFSTGLLQLTQGTRLEFAKASEINPAGNGETYDVFIRAKTVALPLTADYKFIDKPQSSFFGGLGIYSGYIY